MKYKSNMGRGFIKSIMLFYLVLSSLHSKYIHLNYTTTTKQQHKPFKCADWQHYG